MRQEIHKAYRRWISLSKKLKPAFERVQRLEAELLRARQDFNDVVKEHDEAQHEYETLEAFYGEEEQY